MQVPISTGETAKTTGTVWESIVDPRRLSDEAEPVEWPRRETAIEPISNAIDAVLFGAPEVLEYEGEVRLEPGSGREEAVIGIEFDRTADAERRAALMAVLGAALRERIGVQFTLREYVGPSLVEGGRDGLLKRQRWTDRRGGGDTAARR